MKGINVLKDVLSLYWLLNNVHPLILLNTYVADICGVWISSRLPEGYAGSDWKEVC